MRGSASITGKVLSRSAFRLSFFERLDGYLAGHLHPVDYAFQPTLVEQRHEWCSPAQDLPLKRHSERFIHELAFREHELPEAAQHGSANAVARWFEPRARTQNLLGVLSAYTFATSRLPSSSLICFR